MYCIPLYIVCSSPSSKKWLFFVDSVHLTHFWKWDLSSIKKKSVYLNWLQCGVLYLRYFYFCRFKEHVHGRSLLSGIFLLLFVSFCHVFKAIIIALMEYKSEWSGICLSKAPNGATMLWPLDFSFLVESTESIIDFFFFF